MDFKLVWSIVGELAGEAFVDELGLEFRYRFKKTFIVVAPGGVSIPRTNFEKIFKNPAGVGVQGARFIKAIYRHAAFQSQQS